MRTVKLGLVRNLKDGLTSRFQRPHSLRALSTNALPAADEKDEKPSNNSFEPVDFFKRGVSGGQRSLENKREDSLFQKIDKMRKDLDSLGSNWVGESRGKPSNALDGLDESFESLQDGSVGKLEKAAMAFGFSDFHDGQDRSFGEGLGNRRDRGNAPQRRVQPRDVEITTEEALRKADFRNTRFLARFITEGGIIIKRRQTGISAKAQRRIAREIKTARSFGLLPFTTQGTKAFAFGKTMQNLPDDYEYSSFGGQNGNEMSSMVDDNVV